MRNKKILIEEISRMRSMMGLNENFIPRLLLETVSPARIKALFNDLIGAADNASRRSIINNMTTDEKKVFNEFLADPSISKYFGGVRTVDQFVDASVGRELLKLAKVLATNSADFAKKAGKNINFAASIDNLAKIEKELDNLKPSVAGLADDIDPNTDYGKLISSITSKNYDEIDTQVFNDFYSYLDDLKTKTTDPGVQSYLNDVQNDMINIADEVNDITITKGFAGDNPDIKISGGDAGEYIDNVGQLVDPSGTIIKNDPLDGSPLKDGGFKREKTATEIELEKARQDLEARNQLNRDIREIEGFIKGTSDYRGLRKWYNLIPTQYQKDVMNEFQRLTKKVKDGEISIGQLESEALNKIKEVKEQKKLDATNKELADDAKTESWIEKKITKNKSVVKIFWISLALVAIAAGWFRDYIRLAYKNNIAGNELDECFETVPGWDDLDDDVKNKFANLGFGCDNRKVDVAPDKFITNIKYMEANPSAGTSEKFEVVIGGKTETFNTSGVKSKTPTITGGKVADEAGATTFVDSKNRGTKIKQGSLTKTKTGTDGIDEYTVTLVLPNGDVYENYKLKFNTTDGTWATN